MDTSQPSTNAVSASNLFRLGALLDDSRYKRLAKETTNAFESEMLQYPYLFPGLLSSVVFWKLDAERWVSVGEHDQNAELSKYHLSPRGGLRTLLHYKPASDFLKSRCAAELTNKITAQNTASAVYRIDGQE
jgi:uncharacterized protein YyaL (SSP411 family)